LAIGAPSKSFESFESFGTFESFTSFGRSNRSGRSYFCAGVQSRTIGQERDSVIAHACESDALRPADGDLVLLDDVAIGHEDISFVVSIAEQTAG
jgi:hypothetical protein